MMRISSVTLANYKMFKGEHVFKIKGNLVFFVGENNTGKTTVFEAINFLKSGIPKDKTLADIKNTTATDNDHVVCTIKFVGQIKEVIKDFSESKYESYVFEENGEETLLVQRSSEERTITQNGKDKALSIKSVTLWNNETQQYENPSGVDTVLGTLFETQFIWSDTDPSDISDFGSTKICGRLLNDAVGNFFASEQWSKFTEVHKETFHGEGDSLSSRTKDVEKKIKDIVKDQYGEAEIQFSFSLPDTSTFFKSGSILVNDGVQTNLKEKGSGMQRAIALAIIQVYAQNLAAHPESTEKSKPLFFFIDEPEICLHPKAQGQLLKALITISEIRQIFIATHSPYLLKGFDQKKHDLFIFNREDTRAKVTPSELLNLFDWSPSWGEINHAAYGFCSEEFHNELYASLQNKNGTETIADTENWLISAGQTQEITWTHSVNGAVKETLMTYIRNKMHHGDNQDRPIYNQSQLEESIKRMLTLLQKP